jgi:hypothetical protein
MDPVAVKQGDALTSGRGPERRPLAGDLRVRRQERRKGDADEFAL